MANRRRVRCHVPGAEYTVHGLATDGSGGTKNLRAWPPLVGHYLTREGPRATCKRTGCGYPAPFLNNPTEDAMAWTTPTIVEICAGFEVTAYASAE
jgi:coenzyme PQQ precursor peptide PqqA